MRKKYLHKKIFCITTEMKEKIKKLAEKKKLDEAEIIREQIEKACWENNIN
jgi:predicted DNA-binding protein